MTFISSRDVPIDPVTGATAVTLAGQVRAARAKHKVNFNKTLITSVAAIPQTLWPDAGDPGAGAYGATGVGNARSSSTLVGTIAGAMKLANAASGYWMGCVRIGARSSISTGYGTLVLLDRISDCAVAVNQADASFSPVLDATARLPAGEGGKILIEVTSALSAAANTIALTYTDQADASSVTPTITTTASAAAGRSCNSLLYQSLAAGDSGVRTITAWDITANTATGTVCVAIVRELARFSISAAAPQAYGRQSFDGELVMAADKIYDNSCLMWAFIPGAAATTPLIEGDIQFIELAA